jgi:osmotically-inducible protein OsmY
MARPRSGARQWITTARQGAADHDGDAWLRSQRRYQQRIVTLFGVVASKEAKQAAEAEVRKVGGVKNVVNDLQVVAEAKQERVERKDDQIGKAIQTRFDAISGLEDSDIDIAVSNGVARLTGTVVSRSDQVAALTVARSTAGVVRVIDDLRLEPPAVSAR